MVSCSVPGCSSARYENPNNYTFHRMPQNIARRKTWLKMINRGNWVPKKYSSICSKHFEEHCFTNRPMKRVKLRYDSIPTLFMPVVLKQNCNGTTEDVLEVNSNMSKLHTQKTIDLLRRRLNTSRRKLLTLKGQRKQELKNKTLTKTRRASASYVKNPALGMNGAVRDLSDLPTIIKKEPEEDIPEGSNWHEGFKCDNCHEDIIGLRYMCVQCTNNLDLCAACESDGAHSQHYVLRVPVPRPNSEIQSVLARIRKCLMRELDSMSAVNAYNDDTISIKSELKLEESQEDFEEVEDQHQLFTQLEIEQMKDEPMEDSADAPFLEDSIDLNDKESENVLPIIRSADEEISVLNDTTKKKHRGPPVCEIVSDTNNPRGTPPPIEKKCKIIPSQNTSKRLIVIKMSNLVKLEPSDPRIAKTLSSHPSMSTREVNKRFPTILSQKTDELNPTLKLFNVPISTLLEPGLKASSQLRLQQKPEVTDPDGIV